MGQLVFIVGKSGMGKSTSARNLDPDKTVIINSDQKDLPFPKFRSNYNEEKGNYIQTSDVDEVIDKLRSIQKDDNITSVIIDTWSRMMTDGVMTPAFVQNKGFEKWGNFSFSHYKLINIINEKLRDDLVVYLFCHPETVYDESGFPRMEIAVQGKQIKKFFPESFSSIVLYAEAIKNPGNPVSYIFRTVTGGDDTCKTPMGMFSEEHIENDLVQVNEAITSYYS